MYKPGQLCLILYRIVLWLSARGGAVCLFPDRCRLRAIAAVYTIINNW